MAQTQVQPPGELKASATKVAPEPDNTRPRSRFDHDTSVPVNQIGCFEADRVLKSGYVLRRTRMTKVSILTARLEPEVVA